MGTRARSIVRLGWGLGAVVGVSLTVACGRSESTQEPPEQGSAERTTLLGESPAATRRVTDLRERFVITPPQEPVLPDSGRREKLVSKPQPVIVVGVAEGFERTGNRVRPILDESVRRPVSHTATVELPLRANDAVKLEDDTSHIAVSFALRGASDVEVAVTDPPPPGWTG